MILIYIILLLIVIYSVFFISQSLNILVKGYAPLVSTNQETIKRIIDEVKIGQNDTVYELGCGQAKFLRSLEKTFPQTKLFGFENLFSVYLMTKIKLKLQGSKINIIKKDIFKVNLSSAHLIYCYLNNETMEKLGEILQRVCKPNTQIVSRSFPIPQLKAEKTLKIKGKHIYFYKF